MKPRDFYEVDKLPCWYAIIEKGEKRKQLKWKIGVKYLGETEEYSFGVTSFNLEDEKVWNNLNSLSFANNLIKLFKSGGKKAVKEWLRNEIN